jgi:hypothetical protein
VWHVAHMGEMRNSYNILDGKPHGKRLGVDRKTIFELILEK